jgi:hypothetical protein
MMQYRKFWNLEAHVFSGAINRIATLILVVAALALVYIPIVRC